MAGVQKRPLYAEMEGVLYPKMFSPKCFREALHYEARPEDVFISTYPKCGTTWMQTVALFVFRKGKELEHVRDFLPSAPFIDMLGLEGIRKMPRPGAFKTHLPYHKMPYHPQAKYIFVARNPKDCCISFFHHARNALGFGYWNGQLDGFFELFMAGELEYNDYFDHLLSWYPHRRDPNAFHTTYEAMKGDIRKVVVDLAAFLGEEYLRAIQEDNAVLRNIVHLTSFEYMKKNLSEVYEMKGERDIRDEYEGLRHMEEFTAALELPEVLPQCEFVRKGIVGDWKNFLSEEQTERLDAKFREKMKDTEVLQWFDE